MSDPTVLEPSAGARSLQPYDRRRLARALSWVEAGDERAAEFRAAGPVERGYLIGVTGPMGAGKSTLTDRLISVLRARGELVGVLAVDPSSPVTEGALLGDRIRMASHTGDPGVFIRSMATRGHLGGLAAAVPAAANVFAAFGFDWVVIETVGVGQAEVDIAKVADTTVVVLTPGWGDDVQASKAGLMEIADVFVVNKADRPGAERTRRELQEALELGTARDWQPPVELCSAETGTGVDAVWAAVARHREHLGRRVDRPADDRLRALRACVRETAAQVAADALRGERFADLVAAVVAGRVEPNDAAKAILAQLGLVPS
jgi:LAO/AO transport system kinase